MNKRKISSLLVVISLVLSMSLLQGCKLVEENIIARGVESLFNDDGWEESSDESDEELDSELEEKALDDDKQYETKQKESDKDKDNNSSQENTTKASSSKKNTKSENTTSSKISGDKSNSSKSTSSKSTNTTVSANTSSNSPYDKQMLKELLKTNIALAKDTEVTITEDISLDQLGEIAIEVADKNGFGGYIKNVSYSLTGRKAKIIYNYVDGKEGFLKKYNYVNEKVNVIVAALIKDGMSDYEKELAIHDYIVNYARYDIENLERNTVPRDSYTAYGLLTNKKAVCSGYAEIMYRLLNKAGIETHIVTGRAKVQEHAWNLVKIGGKYYHLDATFDDPVTSNGSNVLSYGYFNLTDNEIAINHTWDRSLYPAATSTAANYFYVNKLVAKNYDEFCSIIKKELLNKKEKIMIKTTTYDTKVYEPSALFKVVNDNKINYVASQFSYSYDAETKVFQFDVKYK